MGFQSSLRVDLAAVLRPIDNAHRLAADSSADERYSSASTNHHNNHALTPKHILASALLLFGTLCWCVFVWCGLLAGDLEGALLAFFCVLPLALAALPMGVCRPRCAPRRLGSPMPLLREGSSSSSGSSVGSSGGSSGGDSSCCGLAGCFVCSATMRRVLWPSARAAPPFVEVLVADALCSLSKVFADAGLVAAVLLGRLLVYCSNTMPFAGLATSLDPLNPSSGLDVHTTLSLLLPPLLASLPFLLRMQQLSVTLRRCDARDRPLHWVNMAK